ncbi:unnamed protein product [Ilex paraguariensis]|uniref:Uncharacterized protein n=1 Tax=Ilex paraguariensis TaxID=185542 RepID=A0ABC8TGE8_9AQUA
MAESSASETARYIYVHDVEKGPLEAIDVHHIVVRKSSPKGFIVVLCTLLPIATSCLLFLIKFRTKTGGMEQEV